MMYRVSVILILTIGAATSVEEKYKLCATEDIMETTCNSLARGSSRVSCLRVTDTAECAIKMSEGKADFGVFNTEEMLLAYQFYPEGIRAISQLRHIDKVAEDFEFQSVAVVPSSFDAKNGLAGLKKSGLCHPGFSEAQMWNDGILKYFEKKVQRSENGDETSLPCRGLSITASENEIENLQNFFGSACRPGKWLSDKSEDIRMKSKHPELCKLCDHKINCTYNNDEHHGHFGALECLVSGRGKVAYVAYDYVQQYFGLKSNHSLSPYAVPLGFQFLCENGETRPLTSENPCGWIRQPWDAIVARTEKSKEILAELKIWLGNTTKPTTPPDWKSILHSVLLTNKKPHYFQDPLTLKRYLMEGRKIELPKNNPCGKKIRWCTTNIPETHKCDWIANEATIGLDNAPRIECSMANSTLECLKNIAENRADIITIDSNYGHIAREVFDLTTIMYAETNSDRNSQVVAVVREDAPNKVKSLRDLKKRNACFPEYGGIAWMSFVNIARTAKIISDSCDYPQIISDFFNGACAPGIKDLHHSKFTRSSKVTDNLCSLCPEERGINDTETCSANDNNDYYGDKGALDCIASGVGDVAFVETQNLLAHIDSQHINPDDYRVLCKNGSLALNTGFEIDEQCALSVTIDSEVIGRKVSQDDKDTIQVLSEDITLTLLKLESWLGYRPGQLRPIRIYDSFSEHKNLLFKDSTLGLVPLTSQVKSVLAYKELFSHVESCSGVKNIVSNFFAIFLVMTISFARLF